MKRVALLFGLIVCFLPMSLFVREGLSQEMTRDSKSVVAAVLRHFPPVYDVDESGRSIGYGVDVMNAIARRAGLKVEFVVYPNWSAAEDALQSGAADLIPDSGITKDRQETRAFSRPTSTFDISFFVLAENRELHDLKSLRGKKIGVSSSNAAVKKLEEQGGFSIVPFNSYDASLLALFRHQVDAIAHPSPTAWRSAFEIGLAGNLRELTPAILTVERGVSVRIERADLLSILNSAIDSFIDSPEHDEIFEHWYGWSVPFWTLSKIIFASSVLLVLIIVVLVLWRFFSLRRANVILREKEKALAKSEALLWAILDNAPVSIYLKDSDGHLIMSNLVHQRHHGMSPEQLMGKTSADYDSPEIAHENFLQEKMIVEKGRPLTFETDRDSAKKGKRRVLVVRFPVKDPDGALVGTGGINIDVTDLKRAEDALKESMELNQRILESAGDGIFGLDVEGRTTFANGVAIDLLGWSADELIGKSQHHLIHDRKADGSPHPKQECQICAAYINGATFKNSDDVFWRKDGTSFPVEYTSTPVMMGDKPVGAVVVFRDVTERKRADEVLRESEEKYRRLYRELPQPYQSLDENGCFIEVNDAWCQLLGFDREEVIGCWFGDFLPESNRPAFEKNFPRFKAEGRIHIDGYEMVAKDGTIRVAAFDGKIAYRSDGSFLQTHCILADITERNALEQKLIHAQKMEAVGQLTGGVAHDFNNLLQVIETNLEMAREATRVALPNVTELIDAALMSERRGAELTRKLLVFSRKRMLRPHRLDIDTWLVGEVKLLTRTLGEDVEIRTEISNSNVAVEIDEGALSNAILNLAINARAAMPNGGTLTLAVSRCHFGWDTPMGNDTLPPGDYVEIAVVDTGFGMSEETLQKAFEPFFTTKDVGEGSGLGLSMVYGFVQQSGGAVALESELGKGTAVKILLPAAMGIVTSIDNQGPTSESKKWALKVLLVEDDENVRYSTVMVLESSGFEVVVADRAAPAIDILQNDNSIELLVTDVVLPGGANGIELANEAVGLCPDLKVILVSGYPDATLVKSGLSEVNFHLLPKPFSKLRLLESIALVMAEKL